MSSGTMPLFRMKCRAVGVTSSSSRCAGVSAFTGRSLSTVRPSLPTIFAGLAAIASGMNPEGMLR